MKVTAMIPDQLVKDVKHFSKGKNITQSLIIALNEWLSLKRVKELNTEIFKKPLLFKKGFDPQKLRQQNREI